MGKQLAVEVGAGSEAERSKAQEPADGVRCGRPGRRILVSVHASGFWTLTGPSTTDKG